MCAAAVLEADARGPVASGLDEELASGTGGESLVAAPVDVGRRRPGDVGDDVLLELAGADPHDARRPGRVRSRGVTSTPSAADSHGKRAPRGRADAPPRGRREPAQPILEHRPRRARVRRREERQHENVAVPEDVATVGVTRETAGTDGRFALVRDRRDQVKERETDGELQLRDRLRRRRRRSPSVRPTPHDARRAGARSRPARPRRAPRARPARPADTWRGDRSGPGSGARAMAATSPTALASRHRSAAGRPRLASRSATVAGPRERGELQRGQRAVPDRVPGAAARSADRAGGDAAGPRGARPGAGSSRGTTQGPSRARRPRRRPASDDAGRSAG